MSSWPVETLCDDCTPEQQKAIAELATKLYGIILSTTADVCGTANVDDPGCVDCMLKLSVTAGLESTSTNVGFALAMITLILEKQSKSLAAELPPN